MGRRSTRAYALLLAAGAGVTLAACSTAEPAAEATTPTVADPSSADPTSQAPSPTATSAYCAEFPPQDGTHEVLRIESWWNGSPADADGNVAQDLDEWHEPTRSHPRVALVDTDTGEVLETWDRAACAVGTPYEFVPGEPLAAGSIAAVDMDTDEVVEVFPDPREATAG